MTGGERGSPRTAPGKRGGEGDSSFNGSVLSKLEDVAKDDTNINPWSEKACLGSYNYVLI